MSTAAAPQPLSNAALSEDPVAPQGFWARALANTSWFFCDAQLPCEGLQPFVDFHRDVCRLLFWEDTSVLIGAWVTFIGGALGAGFLIADNFLTVGLSLLMSTWTLYDVGVVGLVRSVRAAREALQAPPPTGDAALLAVAKAKHAAEMQQFDTVTAELAAFLPPPARPAYLIVAAGERATVAAAQANETAGMMELVMALV